MERQRRAANPQNYDGKGRMKCAGQKKLTWKSSKTYEKIRRRKADDEHLIRQALLESRVIDAIISPSAHFELNE